jgi:7-cyano-7-deazaguanine reductase
MTTLDGSPLGKATDYPDRYDASLLFSVSRAPQRSALGIAGNLPFSGCDVWNAYEITWLDLRGRPTLAIGEFRVRAESPAMVESKSLKLYLGSFAQEPLASTAALGERISTDLSRVCGDAVIVTLAEPADFETGVPARTMPAGVQSIDETEVTIDASQPDPELLAHGQASTEEDLSSSLFRSTCPVTGQPDYADIFIRYRGPRIDRAGLLRYLVSYRRHAAFHEAAWAHIRRYQKRCRTNSSAFTRASCVAVESISIPSAAISSAPPANIRTPRQ